jgi:cytoskeleton-associated protein 5
VTKWLKQKVNYLKLSNSSFQLMLQRPFVSPEGMDPMDLIDPVDILSKMPKDFYEKIEAKKWQDRKEALEAVETLVNNPKLQSGDYGDLVRALKKVLQKDSNVLLVAIAGKCLSSLAKGLGKKFQPYSTACIGAILEKFKEKKSNVVAALRDAIDAMYPSTSLESIQEDVMEALNNKNPSVKSETALFLARAFTKTQPTVLNKKLLKTYLAPLLKNLNESDPTVRDSSAEAVGTAMKLVGEKTIGPFLTEVEALKLAKIKECSEKAVITVKIVGVKKERPVTAPSTKAPVVKSIITGPKSSSRPATATAPVKKSAAPNKKPAGGVAKSASSAKITPSEREMSPDEIDEKAAELLTPEILSGLMDVNWKNRCTAVEQFTLAIADIEGKPSSQVLIRALAKKPGLKDTNFQAQKCKLELLKLLILQFGITTVTVDLIINDVVEKLGDVKNCAAASQALTEMAAATKLELIIQKVTEFAFEQKSPKVQQESITWVTSAIREFGFQVGV